MQKKIAAIQMTSTDDWQENLEFVEKQVRVAAEAGAVLAVLPENALLFAGTLLRSLAESEQQQIIQNDLARIARTYQIYLIVGSHPSLNRPDGNEVEEGRVRQSCLVYSNQGELLTRYDKAHLFDAAVNDKNGQYQESRVIEKGELSFKVVEIAGIKVGLSICYDLRFPEMYRQLVDLGADLVVVPAAFTYRTGEAHWHTLLRSRAIENQFFVLGVNQCGQHTPTRETFGNSVCYSPWGDNLGQLQHQPGLLLVDIDLNEIQTCRTAMPVHQHRRL
ncbi:carbon-nitrogen hydrolase family protein [Marinomonas agarivorans]|nr:carbon-nitrogen hydrolase family protein [Marinomonas agarivorans]